MFRIDPVQVLESDTTEWLVRVAAYNVIAADEKKRSAKK